MLDRDINYLYFVHPHPSCDKTLNRLWYRGQRIRDDRLFHKK
jgi:hypothetical protein